jgi:hypothetical protein
LFGKFGAKNIKNIFNSNQQKYMQHSKVKFKTGGNSETRKKARNSDAAEKDPMD